ncbi:MAG: pantoate--beta-alanine ligase [Candidatus Cloacimonetes bacterium]|nr:pantoate--beta-alanine ligase [Candidatus Cloacimonadota bacterium]
MQVIEHIAQMTALMEQGEICRPIGFVPTMGYLHQGHLSLVHRARQECRTVVVSIFVNPTQFGVNEDFDSYPRDLSRDLEMLEPMGVDIVFCPPVREMYPDGYQTFVDVEQLAQILCGARRPGHFRGVTTVVLKLVNIVKADLMYMGEKDFQQCVVLETMLRELNQACRIIRCPIVREADGLAMSSRNVYLSPEDRQKASCLHQAIQLAQRLCRDGKDKADEVIPVLTELILSRGGQIDYIAIVDHVSLQPVDVVDTRSRLLLAVRFGKTRLIDNGAIA